MLDADRPTRYRGVVLTRSNSDSLLRKLKGRDDSPLPLRPSLHACLWQRFDVHEELKAAGLLNAQQEAHVDRCAISKRSRERYGSSRHRRVEATAVWL